ncbi:hypothetical protein E2C01_031857 [Portunus trituberculatus]|uniref:Uncharacterized protein n=1 Tax=Portunus trituberculatus TaxID=210409 RepID=A0A5B7EUJ2_PORTR|nr:hypothetical protein [Portunus trituberculatus]
MRLPYLLFVAIIDVLLFPTLHFPCHNKRYSLSLPYTSPLSISLLFRLSPLAHLAYTNLPVSLFSLISHSFYLHLSSFPHPASLIPSPHAGYAPLALLPCHTLLSPASSASSPPPSYVLAGDHSRVDD